MRHLVMSHNEIVLFLSPRADQSVPLYLHAFADVGTAALWAFTANPSSPAPSPSSSATSTGVDWAKIKASWAKNARASAGVGLCWPTKMGFIEFNIARTIPLSGHAPGGFKFNFGISSEGWA